MKNMTLVVAIGAVLVVSGCKLENPANRFRSTTPNVVETAEDPDYFIRPSEMESAKDVCVNGEVEGVGITTIPVVVLHIACTDGTMFRMDKATGRVFKRSML